VISYILQIMTTTRRNGRLCNQLIRNIAVSLIAKKNDLYVNYYNHNVIDKLGIPLFIGKTSYLNTIPLTDENYFSIYNDLHLKSNLDPNADYFQTKEIIRLIYNYLHSEDVKLNVMYNNPFTHRYNQNNDLFIHIRLTDVEHHNPGLKYYMKAINQLHFDNLYVSSDNIYHYFINQIKEKYPDTRIIYTNEVETIQFATTCRNIILSHGSFSAVIGYLSFFSNIYYPEYDPNNIWYGDMFSIKSWNKITYL